MNSNVSNLSRQLALLGTRRETERVRERVRDILDESQTGFKEIGEGIKKVNTWHDMGVSATPNPGRRELAMPFPMWKRWLG